VLNERDALFAGKPIRLVHPLEQAFRLAAMVERGGAEGQCEAEVEPMLQPTRVVVFFVTDSHGPIGVSQHPVPMHRIRVDPGPYVVAGQLRPARGALPIVQRQRPFPDARE
jgi:hypothetical protein